jgi:hypothetical protein
MVGPTFYLLYLMPKYAKLQFKANLHSFASAVCLESPAPPNPIAWAVKPSSHLTATSKLK